MSELKPYSNQGKLRYWCQKVLPLVYNDSLSYYELLNKVVAYLNNTIADVGICEDNIDLLLQAFEDLQDYVNDQIAEVTPVVEEVIDQMVESGQFGEILVDAIAGVIADEYDSTQSYTPLNYVLYEGEVYCCTDDTTGDWDSTKWRKTTIGDELETLMLRVYNLNAGQIAYDNNENYPLGTVGSNIKSIINAINSLTNNKNIKIVSGAIRNTGSGWSLINDSGHNPINIAGVSVQSLNGIPVLKIDHDVDATKIITLIVGCDETFASLYDIGASVGLDYSYLYIYRKAHTFGGMVQIVENAIDTQYSDFTAGTFYPDGNFVLIFPETLTTPEDVYSVACAGGEGSTAHIKSLGYSNAIVRMNALDGTAWDSTSYPNQTRIYLTFNIRERIADPSTIVNANGNFWILGLLETA